MSENKQEKIVKVLADKHSPDAILLHGSRATGHEREHSDWDFIFLYSGDDTPGNFRENIDGENVEVQSATLPVADILDTFNMKLQHAIVISENDSEGSDLIKQARDFYAKGFEWPKTWPEAPKLWLQGRVDGMKESTSSPEIFLRYFSQFYVRALNYWYHVKYREYSQPVYLALPDMEERDPEYRKLVCDISNPKTSNEEKVVIAEKIIEHLFE